ncbi:ankyrin repeat domain-containing protein 28 [Lasiodiplodia theobromae]|nr:ankyrin repeat domain-containing protein 28 [Lasiodiplodia theobromae]
MSADWWQNLANNFAADLAPLISLFGESPTKQYLSETVTFVDVFIFSMAPLGVITAIVSAIRVAGGPSLRAFIGRAQEGAGIAEAELCSSTSRNVCELYNNGGIARVFGRPKILEFVHDWKWDTPTDKQEQKSRNDQKPDSPPSQQEKKPHDDRKPGTPPSQQEPNSSDEAGIYSFRDYLHSHEDWKEKETRRWPPAPTHPIPAKTSPHIQTFR